MKKKKKLKKRSKNKIKISYSPCHSSSSSSESDNKEEDSVVPKKVRIISKAKESKWALPENMTKYADRFFRLYIPENNLEKKDTKYNPQSVLQYFETFLCFTKFPFHRR